MDAYSGFADAQQELTSSRLVQSEELDKMAVSYATNIDAEVFFQKIILATLVSKVVSVAREITTESLSHARESLVIIIKPTVRIPHRLLQRARKVSLSEDVEKLSNLSNYATVVSMNIVRMSLAVLASVLLYPNSRHIKTTAPKT